LKTIESCEDIGSALSLRHHARRHGLGNEDGIGKMTIGL
jgi:hypothetical protein